LKRAIASAKRGFAQWSKTPAPIRGQVLQRVGQLMVERKDDIARAMTREMGKVLAEARGDVQEGIDIAFLMAGEGRRMAGETVPSELPDTIPFTEDLSAQLVVRDANGQTVFQRSGGAVSIASAETLGPGRKRLSLNLPELPPGWRLVKERPMRFCLGTFHRIEYCCVSRR
jgi:hypothetical protein